MVSVEVKYDFTPYDGTPGKPWEDYEDRLLNSACAAKSDDRGWSLADHINGVDEGSARAQAVRPTRLLLQHLQKHKRHSDVDKRKATELSRST